MRRSPWTPCHRGSAFFLWTRSQRRAMMNEIRLALRSLARRRAYTALVVAILAIGIGVNTAVFGLVDAVLIRSLPYQDPDSLVVVFADGRARNLNAHMATTAADFMDWRQSAAGFTALAA